MSRLCVIPCGSRKIWDAHPLAAGTYPAEQAYIGAFHRKCRAYARQFFEQWVILSAKHGFLLPGDELSENYNTAFGANSPEEITIQQLLLQAGMKQLNRFDHIVVLGGKKFTAIIPNVFTDAKSIAYPLVGCKGIGYMLQRLDEAVRSKTEL